MLIIKLKLNSFRKNNKTGHPWWFTICNSNGRCLASSEMYASKQGAQKAIAAFTTNGLEFKYVEEIL